MRAICLSILLGAVMASSAVAQTPPAAETPAAAPVKLTGSQVRTLRLKVQKIDMDIRRELMAYFRNTPGAANPMSLTDAAMASGLAFTAKPVSEKHGRLVAERKQIVDQLLAAGEVILPSRSALQARVPQSSAAFRAPSNPMPQLPKEWR